MLGTSPFIEGVASGVGLYTVLLDEEAHLVKEGGRRAGGLFAEEDVLGIWRHLAILVIATGSSGTTVWVQAIQQSIYKAKESMFPV